MDDARDRGAATCPTTETSSPVETSPLAESLQAAEPPAPDGDGMAARRSITGSANKALAHRLIDELRGALWLPADTSSKVCRDKMQAAMAALAGIKPQDEIEGMLGVQMVATHTAALECLRRAMLPEQSFEARQANLKHADKLMKTYLQQVAALDRHRGKGAQKVVVEHVHVAAGGQALVGAISLPPGRPSGTPSPRHQRPDEQAMHDVSAPRRSGEDRDDRGDDGRKNGAGGRPAPALVDMTGSAMSCDATPCNVMPRLEDPDAREMAGATARETSGADALNRSARSHCGVARGSGRA